MVQMTVCKYEIKNQLKANKVVCSITVQSAERAMSRRTSLSDTSVSVDGRRTRCITRGWCRTLVARLATNPSVRLAATTVYCCVTQVRHTGTFIICIIIFNT